MICAISSRIARARALSVSLASTVWKNFWLRAENSTSGRLSATSRCASLRNASIGGLAQELATFLVAVEEHVLLAGEMIEHRHSPDVGGFRDLVDRHGIEAPLHEQKRGRVGDALSRGEALAGSAVGRR